MRPVSSSPPRRAEPDPGGHRPAVPEPTPGDGGPPHQGVASTTDPGPTSADPWWLPPQRRNRYYDGKFLSARDFALDPDYALGHRRTAHRLFHGWGVAVGLAVRWTRRGLVEVGPGLAIDPSGRELVVDRPLTIEVAPARNHHDTVLALHYERRAVTPQERLLDNGRRSRSEPGQWLDTVRGGRFDNVRGWRVPEPWVPVARLVRGADGRRDLRLAGRPDLELRPTRIRRIDWPHGGDLPAGELWRRGGRVSLTFDRPLASPHSGLGIGPETLRLALGRPQGLRQPLRGRVWSQGHTAHFEIDPGHRAEIERMRGAHLYVTLLCDAVLDHLHRRVSATPPWIGHNRPAAPGGLFESWCRLHRRRRGDSPGAEAEPIGAESIGTDSTGADPIRDHAGSPHGFEGRWGDASRLADEVFGAPHPPDQEPYRPPSEPPQRPPASADGIRHLGVIDVARLAREGQAAYFRHPHHDDTYSGDPAGDDWPPPVDEDPWGDAP